MLIFGPEGYAIVQTQMLDSKRRRCEKWLDPLHYMPNVLHSSSEILFSVTAQMCVHDTVGCHHSIIYRFSWESKFDLGTDPK